MVPSAYVDPGMGAISVQEPPERSGSKLRGRTSGLCRCRGDRSQPAVHARVGPRWRRRFATSRCRPGNTAGRPAPILRSRSQLMGCRLRFASARTGAASSTTRCNSSTRRPSTLLATSNSSTATAFSSTSSGRIPRGRASGSARYRMTSTGLSRGFGFGWRRGRGVRASSGLGNRAEARQGSGGPAWARKRAQHVVPREQSQELAAVSIRGATSSTILATGRSETSASRSCSRRASCCS